MQGKKQPGRRTRVRKPGGAEHVRTGLARSTSFGRKTWSHTACVRRTFVQKFSTWKLAWTDPHHLAGWHTVTQHMPGGSLSRYSPCELKKYHPYKMQVVRRSSDTDNIIAQMHHLDLVICNGHQGHVTLTATHFFQNYLGNVCTTSSHHRRAVNIRLLHYSQCSSEDIHGYLYIETTAVNCQEAFTYGGCNF